ncbi:MAG: hypothetical protein ABH878_00110, partial [bacterium]
FKERWNSIDWQSIDSEMRYYYVRNYQLLKKIPDVDSEQFRIRESGGSIDSILSIPRDISDWSIEEFRNWVQENCP